MDYDYLKYKKILIVDDEADLREMVPLDWALSSKAHTPQPLSYLWDPLLLAY